jgi:hypothetical protein
MVCLEQMLNMNHYPLIAKGLIKWMEPFSMCEFLFSKN